MRKAWCSLEEVPFAFWGHPFNLGHTGWKFNDLDPIWVRLLGQSQLSNHSDLSCFDRNVTYMLAIPAQEHQMSIMMIHCLFTNLFKQTTTKIPKLCTGVFCGGNPLVVLSRKWLVMRRVFPWDYVSCPCFIGSHQIYIRQPISETAADFGLQFWMCSANNDQHRAT